MGHVTTWVPLRPGPKLNVRFSEGKARSEYCLALGRCLFTPESSAVNGLSHLFDQRLHSVASWLITTLFDDLYTWLLFLLHWNSQLMKKVVVGLFKCWTGDINGENVTVHSLFGIRFSPCKPLSENCSDSKIHLNLFHSHCFLWDMFYVHSLFGNFL